MGSEHSSPSFPVEMATGAPLTRDCMRHQDVRAAGARSARRGLECGPLKKPRVQLPGLRLRPRARGLSSVCLLCVNGSLLLTLSTSVSICFCFFVSACVFLSLPSSAPVCLSFCLFLSVSLSPAPWEAGRAGPPRPALRPGPAVLPRPVALAPANEPCLRSGTIVASVLFTMDQRVSPNPHAESLSPILPPTLPASLP